ncbi:hypothetical protein MSG28_006005 [Choristoneura fumiferana]|uniref:Uncharacterized protein n=1 Tax=Choristoneura fumiferana TaxID=7141 RepID=A0ACC0L211_CHOFU|nr:hypothetical protein MSG28_006005 [Choristoneura fumiferana]
MSGVVKQFPVEKEYEKNPDISPEDILKLREWLKTQPHLPGDYLDELDLIISYHCCERSAEVSKQGVHFLNAPGFMDKLLLMLRPFLKKDLLDMLYIHQRDSSSTYDHIPKKAFPKNYNNDPIVQVILENKGAFMFQAIEGASEMERVHNMTLERDKTAQCLWRYALELNVFNNSGLKHRYIMFGSMIFGLWENWDQLDGAYFCFISLSSFITNNYSYTSKFSVWITMMTIETMNNKEIWWKKYRYVKHKARLQLHLDAILWKSFKDNMREYIDFPAVAVCSINRISKEAVKIVARDIQGSSPYFRNALLEDIEEFVKQTGRLLDFSYDDYFINHFEYLINSPNHATFDSDRVIGRMEQRKCLFKDEKPEIYKDMYSYSACLVQCRIKTFLKLCRCVPESSRGLEEELQDSLDCPDCLPDCEFTRYDLKSFWTPVEAGLNKKNVCVVMLYHPTLDGVLNRLDVVTILLKPTKVLFSHKNEESGKEELRSVVAYQNPFTGDYCVHKSHPPKGYMNALPSPESTDSGVSDEYEPLKPTVGIPDSEYEKGKDYGHFNIKEHCRLASICEDNSVNKTRNWNYKEYQI